MEIEDKILHQATGVRGELGGPHLSQFICTRAFCGFSSVNGLDTGIRLPLPRLPDCGVPYLSHSLVGDTGQ